MIVIVIFCIWTSHPKNVLHFLLLLFFLLPISAFISCKVLAYKKCSQFNVGIAMTELIKPISTGINCLYLIVSSLIEGNVQFIILCNLPKSLVKVAVFVIFPTSIMVLFEFHQRFKGQFLNELRVSFKH